MSKLTHALIGLCAVVFAQHVSAEVIQCDGVDGDVRFEVNVAPNEQDPTALKVISLRVSDPNVSEARTEVALFEAADGLVNASGDVVVGYVDATNPKTGRKGERIGGTTLGQLRSIMLRFDVGLIEATSSGKKHSAEVSYLKKMGRELVQDLDCALQK